MTESSPNNLFEVGPKMSDFVLTEEAPGIFHIPEGDPQELGRMLTIIRRLSVPEILSVLRWHWGTRR